MTRTNFMDQSIKAVFDAYPLGKREQLLRLRKLIFECAASMEGVGHIEETLKWGQPAYLTTEPKTGTTIRLGISKSGNAAFFTHCQTTVMTEFQALFPNSFTFEGNRAVYVDDLSCDTINKLSLLVKRALTYHLGT